jgi:hypothetical protein
LKILAKISGSNSHLDIQMPELHALVYVSTATTMLSLADIEHLLTCAQKHNQEEDITGVLLYDAGNFMQYLEGPLANLMRVYQVIKNSSKHHGIVELLNWKINEREFPDWAMAFRSVNALGMTLPNAHGEPLLEWLAAPLNPVSAAGVLLTNFWNRSRMPHGF